MRSISIALVLGSILAVFTAGQALAERIEARVSISRQVMQVYHEGRLLYEWPVSTAAPGKITPTGSFKPEYL